MNKQTRCEDCGGMALYMGSRDLCSECHSRALKANATPAAHQPELSEAPIASPDDVQAAIVNEPGLRDAIIYGPSYDRVVAEYMHDALRFAGCGREREAGHWLARAITAHRAHMERISAEVLS